MTKAQLSKQLVRHAAVKSQLLDGRAKLPKGKEGVARLVEQLGYVQIDTIAVINRAHHHTMWARRPDYDPAMLHELQARDRRVFEYWGHAASILPMADYRFYLPLMKRHRDAKQGWVADQKKKCAKLLKPVMKRIRDEGPLSSKDFEAPAGSRGTWWDWKPAKAALELLFWQGDLMISERVNFHRLYDLTERVLPESVDTTEPGKPELGRFLVRRALNAYVVAMEKDIREHLKAMPRNEIGEVLHELVEAGEVVEIGIEGGRDRYYTLPRTLETITKLRPVKPELALLSPFDNLVIQRVRLRKLFDFDYSIECYTPEKKRRYGYFCLPILWGEALVGRLDPKADRAAKKLLVKSLHLEPGFKPDEGFLNALASKLNELAAFNGCESVQLDGVNFKGIKRKLQSLLKN